MAGGRRWSPVVASMIVLLMLLFGHDLGKYIPLSALSGVIIYIGLKMINLNILAWFKSRYTRVYGINAIMVLAVSIAFDVTTAVAFGLIFAVINFIWSEIKRPLIRRESNIIEYPSPRKRSEKQYAILSQHADKACLVELQGNLYFARTDQLYRKIMEMVPGRSIIILHFRRVLSIDMSGLVVLMQLVETARQQGTEIVFAHLHRRLGFGRKTKSAFSMIESDKKRITRLFHSTERALEYAEELILKAEYKDKDYRVSSPVMFEENDLCENIATDDVVLLKKLATKHKYKHKDIVVNEDERCSALYLVTRGFVEQRLYNGPKSYKVLAKHSPGTYFGKSSFFNKGKVSATYVAQGDTVVYKISKQDLENETCLKTTGIYARLLFVIGRQLSKEARSMIAEIHRLEAL
jgi:anti-anti-sigma factor